MTTSPPEGVLVVDKPPGPTSHDVVARVRRLLRTPRIGHTGTLDPLATGVLPLVVGRATRLAALLSSGEKTYEASVRLGVATESYDAAERLEAGLPPPADPAIDPERIAAALDQFRGTCWQAPPPYSAKKVGGVASHRLARRNTPAQLTPVSVTVSELNLVSIDAGLVRLVVTASAGFYVRSLAHELGKALGCGGHLEALRRTRAGEFAIEQAVPLNELEADPAAALARLVPMESLLPRLPAVVLTESGTKRAGHGNEVGPRDFAEPLPGAAAAAVPAGSQVRLIDPAGRLLGIARAAGGGVLRPAVVLV